ncbi:MAG: branched-chain amino acid ABC transporter permease [Thermoleophilaceae bacterium]
MRRELVGWGLFLVVAAALPQSGLGQDRYLMLLANVMLMFVALALSWDIVARTGQLSLAHAAFFGIGAYAVALGHKYLALHPLLALVLAGTVGAAVALGLGVVTLRLHGIYFAIATLAFAEVLRTLALQVPDVTGGPVGISMPPLFGGDRVASYYLVGAVFVLALALSLAVRYTPVHYAVSAIRANEAIAAVMGVNVVRTKVLLFTASAMLATLAGAFYMPFITHTDPHDAFDVSRSVAALVFPIFGGIYTTAGPVLGTLVLRSFEEYLRVTPPWKEGYQVVYGAVIVFAVLFMPRGVLGLLGRTVGRPGVLARIGSLVWRSSR